MSSAVEEAKKALEVLPTDATWEDIIHEIYVRKKVAAALEDEAAGRIVSHEDVRRRFPNAQ